MNKLRNYLLTPLLAALMCISGKNAPATITPTFANCRKCIVLTEQSQNRIAIVDLDKKTIVWDWHPELSNIKPEHMDWFKLPSDAKPVYGGTCILMNASGGGVALLRIADKKVLFYAEAGGNTHSAEVLPDGNIVSASSTGNFMKVFRVDTVHFPENVYSKTIALTDGHNVVWDKKKNRLWSATMSQLKAFRYNFDCMKPDFVPVDSIALPGSHAHDLFPVYGRNALFVTNLTDAFRNDFDKQKLEKIPQSYHDVKSVSSGPAGYPQLVMIPDGQPKSWWNDQVNTMDGQVIYKEPGLKIYKARWFLENEFSYATGTKVKTCKVK